MASTSADAAAAGPSNGVDEHWARRRYRTTEQKIIRMYRGEDDDEIAPVNNLRVSLICPVS